MANIFTISQIIHDTGTVFYKGIPDTPLFKSGDIYEKLKKLENPHFRLTFPTYDLKILLEGILLEKVRTQKFTKLQLCLYLIGQGRPNDVEFVNLDDHDKIITTFTTLGIKSP